MRRGLVNAQAYRSGMVLGLTLAEIMVLLVFMMLLAAAALLLQQDSAVGALDDRVRGLAAARAEIQVVQARVTGLETALDQSRRIAEQADQARAQSEGAARRQYSQATATLATLTEDLAAARGEAQTLGGQNAQMRGEIQRIHGNAGSGLPYCWTASDGKPVTLLRITLRDTGVVAQDPAPRPRAEDTLWTKLVVLPRDQLLPMEIFLTQVGAAIEKSNSDRCRHALEVIDGTGPSNKRGYKSLMNQLWGNFLLREVGG